MNSGNAPIDHPLWDASSPGVSSTLRRDLWVISRSRGLVAAITVVCVLSAVVYNFFARPIYQATSVISLDVAGASPLKVGGGVEANRLVAALQEQCRILESTNLALAALDGADRTVLAEMEAGSFGDWKERLTKEWRRLTGGPVAAQGPAQTVEALRSRLIVERQGGETWVYVRMFGYDPVAAAAAVNRLVDVYLSATRKETEGAVRSIQEQVQEQVAESKERVVATLGQLEKVDKATGLQNVETRRTFLQKEVARLQDALIESKSRAMAARTVHDEVQRLPLDDLATIPSIRDDREVAGSLDRIAEVESRLATVSATLGEKHPDVVAVRAELDAARRTLRARLAGLKEAAGRTYRLSQREMGELSASLERAQSDLASLDRSSVERSFIQKQAEAGQRAAEDLIAKSVREADSSIFFEPRVLQRAEIPVLPVSPQRARNLQFSLVFGIFLGLAAAWLRAHLDETVKTPEDVKMLVHLPLIGMVPRIEGSEFDLFRAQSGADARLFESYRALRTNVVQGAGGAGRLILVTSSREGEGKTTTSCGLAIALARAGNRVLLVDGDLRRASLSHLLSAGEQKGLLNAIEQGDLESCIVETPVPNLNLLPAGPPRPDAAELLTRDQLGTLLSRLRDTYDWVICDAPPVLAVADALVLCRFAESVLIVIGANETPLGSIRATIEQLLSVGAPIRGVVLNSVDLGRDSHYYRHYYSGQYEDYSTRMRSGAPSESPLKRKRSKPGRK